MRRSLSLWLILVLVGFSCDTGSEATSNYKETLRLTHRTMRKIVDLQVNGAIWTDEQRGRNNEEIIARIKRLAISRKDLDFTQSSAVEKHVATLDSLASPEGDELSLEQSFERLGLYLATTQEKEQDLYFLQVEISQIEFVLVEHWSRQLGIIDCCFPSPVKVQTNGDGTAGELYEMAIFPDGERVLGEQATFTYESVYLTRSGAKVPVEVEKRRIGHVMILQFVLADPGPYAVHFTVVEEGDYLAEPWQQVFEWPILMN